MVNESFEKTGGGRFASTVTNMEMFGIESALVTETFDAFPTHYYCFLHRLLFFPIFALGQSPRNEVSEILTSLFRFLTN